MILDEGQENRRKSPLLRALHRRCSAGLDRNQKIRWNSNRDDVAVANRSKRVDAEKCAVKRCPAKQPQSIEAHRTAEEKSRAEENTKPPMQRVR